MEFNSPALLNGMNLSDFCIRESLDGSGDESIIRWVLYNISTFSEVPQVVISQEVMGTYF